MLDFLTGKPAVKYMDQVGQVFKQIPHLPKEIVNLLVSVVPWLALLGGVLGAIGAVTTVLGGSAVYRASWMMAGVGSGYSLYIIIAAVFSAVMAALLLMAFAPLKDKKAAGWAFLFWANVISIAQNLVGLVLWHGSIVGIILSVAIGLYLLYEVRPMYK